MQIFWIINAIVVLVAIFGALAEPAIARWASRRDERVRLRAVTDVVRMFNGGGR